jgi:uncharacterized membrane protein
VSAPAVLLLAFAIGVAAGLRALTPVAVVAWAAHLGWLPLHGTALGFLGSPWAVGVFTLAALFELVNDKLPKTPSRKAPAPFAARVLLGGLAGASIAAGHGGSLGLGAVLGAAGGVAGTLGGYEARTRAVRALGIGDLVVALVEDALAIASSLFLVTR